MKAPRLDSCQSLPDHTTLASWILVSPFEEEWIELGAAKTRKLPFAIQCCRGQFDLVKGSLPQMNVGKVCVSVVNGRA